MKKYAYLIIPILLSSCCNNISIIEEALFRTAEDPFPAAPFADPFSLEHTVYLSWDADDAADSFCLMRSYDQEALSFSCIYSGNGTEFTDTDTNAGSRYIYRLDKIRGNKYFTGTSYAFGCSSDCRKDCSENNDTEAEAALLEYDLICNLICVQYITEKKLFLDEDWFYVTIPPHRAAEIIVSQNNLQDDESTGAATKLKIQTAGHESVPVKQRNAYVIKNPSYKTQRFYFKIFPETTGLFPAESNTAVIEYTVSLNRIYAYSL